MKLFNFHHLVKLTKNKTSNVSDTTLQGRRPSLTGARGTILNIDKSTYNISHLYKLHVLFTQDMAIKYVKRTKAKHT